MATCIHCFIFVAVFLTSGFAFSPQCSEKGSCVIYNNKSYRLTMHGTTVAFCIIGSLFAFLLHIKVRIRDRKLRRSNNNELTDYTGENKRSSSPTESLDTTMSDIVVTSF